MKILSRSLLISIVRESLFLSCFKCTRRKLGIFCLKRIWWLTESCRCFLKRCRRDDQRTSKKDTDDKRKNWLRSTYERVWCQVEECNLTFNLLKAEISKTMKVRLSKKRVASIQKWCCATLLRRRKNSSFTISERGETEQFPRLFQRRSWSQSTYFKSRNSFLIAFRNADSHSIRQFDLNFESLSLSIICTRFSRTLTMINYLRAIFSTLSSILSVTNLSRLECAKTQCIRVQECASEYAKTLLVASFRSLRMWCLCFNNFLSKTLQRSDLTLRHYLLKYDRRILSIVTHCDVKYTSNTSLEQQYVFHVVQDTDSSHLISRA